MKIVIVGRYILFEPYRNDLERKESKILSSNNIDIREIAEQHWKYTLGIIERVMIAIGEDIEYSKDSIELMHYLYCQAFIHGFKHYKDDLLMEIIMRKKYRNNISF